MSSSYATCTKEKTISYEQRLFIKRSLRQLGLNSKMDGFIYIQKIIIYAYQNDIIFINFRDICKTIGIKISKPHKTIESAIRYTFDSIDTNKLYNNFEDIFEFEFSISDFSLSTLISDFIDILETI
mgnify:CR=1 FL=1